MAVKIIGINRSTGQPFQLSNATKTNFGNDIGQTDADYSTNSQPRRAVTFFPDLSNGRMKCFAYVNSAATTCYLRQSFEWLQEITHGVVTNGPWAVGDGVSGGTSGATGTIREVVDSTHIVVEISNSTAFQAEVITGTGTGSGKSCTSSAVTGTDIGDAWYNVSPSFSVSSTSFSEYDDCGHGFHPFYDGTDLKLAWIHYYSFGAALRMMSYDSSTDAWTNHGAVGSIGAASGAKSAINYKGTIYVASGSANNVVAIDPAALTSSSIAFDNAPYNMGYYGSLFVHNGSLFYVGPRNSDQTTALWELSGGTFTTRSTGMIYLPYGCAGFTAPDGTLVLLASANGSTKAYSINTSTWGVTDITSALPSGYSSLSRTAPFIYVDRATNGATGDQRILCHFAGNFLAGSTSIAVCTGDPSSGSNWTDLGSFSGANANWLGESHIGEGEFIYEDGSKYGVLTGGLENKAGAQEMSFTVLGGGSADFEMLVAEDTADGDMSRATFRNPSQGSLTDGNKKISGITADGSTKTAEWRGSADGFTDGDVAVRIPFVTAV